ncbi:MAG: hypothetical protein DMG84_13595, partial [Acidobacteria bacterium]
GLADRESASSVWAEFSTDFFVRAVDRGGRRTHPRAYFATLPLEGDAERREEQLIAREQPQADLLKIAHHGSTTSTIPELLAAVRPRFAVISSGVRNVYGRPRMEVLNRLEQSKVATYRTDLNGAVTFYQDGQGVSALVVH